MEIREKEVYTPDETALLLKISNSTFRRLVKKGMLRAVKVGGQYRILGREILRIMNPTLPTKVRKVYRRVMKQLDAV
ncbi:MAG: helix-turn-helix domain-containing protein [Candidatus Saganbacteria bacterium]|nr:helix-turn-helix domain-containing protein [Candidatus Saganbacteria bacterium]